MFRRLWIAIAVFFVALTGARGADADPLRLALEQAMAGAAPPALMADAQQRYYLEPETVSPDGVWALGFGAGRPFDDFLLDIRRRRVVGKLPHLSYFNGPAAYYGGEELFVASGGRAQATSGALQRSAPTANAVRADLGGRRNPSSYKGRSGPSWNRRCGC
ncbi:hypothetical protein [Chthoniobacter flavus]|uniref:hypothetical protein n=1 Tax=Chthoniobacter flavus TaxID=191863 RepID=UPI00104EB7C5|nr:hypothetical protein [Chthoniobacter flavus]